MAEAREQINLKVAVTTKVLLLRYCQEKHTTQGRCGRCGAAGVFAAQG